MKISVIDIGSNSVRLMTWADGTVLYKRIQTTRLAEGLAQGVLQEEAMLRTANAIAKFVREAQEEGATVYAFATAAVRSAKNGGEFCARVKRLCGVEIDVVSGEQEARLGLMGALQEEEQGGIVDIGGASTEICMRDKGETCFAQSLNLGAVRLFDGCGQDREKLSRMIADTLATLNECKTVGKIYAVGGTATTLASLFLGLERYDSGRVQNLKLSLSDVNNLADKLLALSVEERKNLVGMDKKRADIIGGGALFLQKLMEKLQLKEIYISDRDNQEGYLAWRLRG